MIPRLQIKRTIIWIVLTESMLILSTRLGAFLHEFIGHGLMAVFLGGRFEGLRLTLFAGGATTFSGDFGEMASACVSLGGIATNLITGIVVLMIVQRRSISFSWVLFGILLAGTSILSQVQYLVLGAYYRYGDPVCLARYPSAMFFVWTGGLAMLAYFSWHLMHLFFRLQDMNFSSGRLFSRAATTLVILGIPVLLYAGLYHSAHTPLGSLASIHEARLRSQKEAERIKAEKKSDKDVEEIQKELEPFPLLPLVVAIYLATAIIAFLQTHIRKRGKMFQRVPVAYRYCLPWVILSGGVLVLISLLW